MKTVIFKLTMPNTRMLVARWSGEGNEYITTERLKDDVAAELDGKSFYHNFGDGWGANIYCEVSSGAAETKRRMKNSKGFCGYDWMVRNIISHRSTKDKADIES